MNLIESLRQLIPDTDRVTANETIRNQHSQDISSYHQPHQPDAVVYPKTNTEVSQIIAFAHQHNIPLVPFGVGTSVEGQVIPVKGGISLNLTMMNNILDIRPNDFLVKVQPGVTRKQLNLALKEHGLFFPVDPGADATLGGMAATNASGTTAVRYGTMRQQVLGLETVLADGRTIHTGGLAVKSSAGYNLTGLFVGSEGTLGIITELTLRVYGIPEWTLAARAVFPDVGAASNAAAAMRMCALPLDRIELVDTRTIQVVNQFKQTTFQEAPTLFLEFSGTRQAVEHDFTLAQQLLQEEGSLDIAYDTDTKARNELWTARHEAALAFTASAPGKRLLSTDVCVPLSALPSAIVNARQAIDEAGLDGGLLGHVGDGNYHAALLIDPTNPDELTRAQHVNEQIVHYALSQGGTCTGEHGIGLGKAKFLKQEHGDNAVQLMQAIKQLLDPTDILNPGKIFLP
ncbi:MAG TPA: FAD-linked oxidase C-terminal domain-containing protein [Bacilli bacterium]|nr:FAD-linked oxidase C-terminal domain-containing protein [Bacilli bacterium]